MKPPAQTGGDRAATVNARASVSARRGVRQLTEDELVAWGRRVGATVKPPVFIGLIGPLGAGKSVLARAVARGAGVRGALPSPTFNIVFRYPVAGQRGGGAGTGEGRRSRGRGAGIAAAVIHADLFRIGSVQELAGIGWEDIVADTRAIVLVEWCGRAGSELPDNRWEVTLGFVDDVARRAVGVEPVGKPSPLPHLQAPREGME